MSSNRNMSSSRIAARAFTAGRRTASSSPVRFQSSSSMIGQKVSCDIAMQTSVHVRPSQGNQARSRIVASDDAGDDEALAVTVAGLFQVALAPVVGAFVALHAKAVF